jgi:hypothetical protein
VRTCTVIALVLIAIVFALSCCKTSVPYSSMAAMARSEADFSSEGVFAGSGGVKNLSLIGTR